MAAKPVDPKLLIEAVRAVVVHGSQLKAAAALGIPRPTLYSRLQQAQIRGITTDAEAAAASETARALATDLQNRVFELEAQLKAVRQATLTDEYVKRKILGIREEFATVKPPKWTLEMPRGRARPGVPVTLWSDWHWGEVVEPTQIGGVNAYNMEIAHQRARRLVERTVYLLRSHVVRPEYSGIVVCLGGDMLSGDIHDELVETNDSPLMPSLLDLFGVLRTAIDELAKEFRAVFLPCVAGNHGRNTKKPRAKNRAFTNFDWLLYQFLAKAFEDDRRVTFHIPDGPDAHFRVFNTRYLLTHGDQFRGGDGIIGPIGPITRGHKRKAARSAAIDQPYDVMLCGHWHQEMNLSHTIVNGSLKGYDEYANQQNFEFEPPRQALWLTHPERGITMRMSVHLEDPPASGAESPWVSVRAP